MDGKNNKKIKVSDITKIAMFTALLFVQEEALAFIPNVQLTFFLLLLYSKKLGFGRTVIIIFLHTILDNLIIGSFNVLYMAFMFLGWLTVPIIICSIFKKIESPIILALVVTLCSFLYSWAFILPSYIIMNIDPLVYLVSDIEFELILAACSFVTTLLLYKPCSIFFDNYNNDIIT